MYAAINVMWMLTIGTAGIFSLASLATVGVGAYGGRPVRLLRLAVVGDVAHGPLFGLVFGVFIAIPAIRLEGFYYALLTVGIAELCRVLCRAVAAARRRQRRPVRRRRLRAGAACPSAAASFSATMRAFVLLLALDAVPHGRRPAPRPPAARRAEKHEAFAEALGINYRAARIQVFLISSAALGGVGGFYATLLHGASPSLFTIDQLLLLLAMIVIGGIGTTEGAVLGTLIVVLLDKVFIGLGPIAVDPDRRHHARHGAVPARRAVRHSRAVLHGAGRSEVNGGAGSPAKEVKSCPTRQPRSPTSRRSISDGSTRNCGPSSSGSSPMISSRSTAPPRASGAATRWSAC